MRPSFNSRGMPSSFVTSTDVSLRREKRIPAKIMKPLFHFFSLHFISPPPPSHLISRSRRLHQRWYIPGGPSQLVARIMYYWCVFWKKKRVSRELEDRTIFVRYSGDWRFFFTVKEREKEVTVPFSWSAPSLLAQFPNLEETTRLLMPISSTDISRFLEISFQKFRVNFRRSCFRFHSFISQISKYKNIMERQF